MNDAFYWLGVAFNSKTANKNWSCGAKKTASYESLDESSGM